MLQGLEALHAKVPWNLALSLTVPVHGVHGLQKQTREALQMHDLWKGRGFLSGHSREGCGHMVWSIHSTHPPPHLGAITW